jgi:hypothetical protein
MGAFATTTDTSSPLGPWTPWRWRLPLLAIIACPAALAIAVEQGREPRGWAAAVVSLCAGFAAVRRTSRVGLAIGWGAAMVLASLGTQTETRALAAFGSLGALACAAAAAVAIARTPSLGGLVRVAPTSPVFPVVGLAIIWWLALVAHLAPSDGDLAWMTESPESWGLGAALASTLVLLAQTEWTMRRRRLELGVFERSLAMRALLGLSVGAAVFAGLISQVPAGAVGRLLVVLASIALAASATHPDAVRVARFTRRVVVLAIAGGAVALMAGSASGAGGSDSWATTIVATVLALCVGSLLPMLEAPLRPAGGAWLDAFARARDSAWRAEPDEAIRGALTELHTVVGYSAISPEVWVCEPPRVTSVDRAGYLHEDDSALPEGLIIAAGNEPECTLRADALAALEVRRPEVRALSKWMADRGALLATVIASDGEPEGVLVLPRVARNEPPTLEEVRALKKVADCLSVACRARASQARLLARANDASDRAEAAEDRLERTRHERALDTGRNTLAAMRLARPATVGGYSVVSRMALEALERRTRVGAPIAIVAPTGVDPVPYLARAHLAGARQGGPLVLVEATSAREHDLARWLSPLASPLALAHKGMLVLLDGAALPIDIQQLLARAFAERRTPWERAEPLDVQLAFAAVVAPEKLVAQVRLDASLALRLADACAFPVVLPRLRDRAEDLRAIITDRLAREGLRVLGRPVGIEHAAYARLIEHAFSGEDAELAVIAQRLVARCSGDVIRVKDVDALRLGSSRRSGGRSGSGARGSDGGAAPGKTPLSA